MNQETAAQTPDGQGWHYVSRNRRTGTHPIGYCRDHVDQPHATETEARECYARYRRENLITFDEHDQPTLRRCEVPGCGEWSARSARVGGYDFVRLCPQHFDAVGVIAARPHLLKPAGDCWAS